MDEQPCGTCRELLARMEHSALWLDFAWAAIERAGEALPLADQTALVEAYDSMLCEHDIHEEEYGHHLLDTHAEISSRARLFRSERRDYLVP